MSKPIVHARSSAKKWGGVAEDYMPIHELMDSSKGAFSDNRHRALTHNSWFVREIIERVFGHEMTNSDGKLFSTREIAEQHCIEDFCGYIPTAQDYLQNIEWEDWMGGGSSRPSSQRKLTRNSGMFSEGFKFEKETRD